jgi:hypothetical protein
MKKPTFKIINKSKEGATVISHGQKVVIPWDEFNRLYIMAEDKVHCTLTDEEFEKWKKADDILSAIVVEMFASNGNDAVLKLSALSKLPALVSKLAETMGISEGDALELARTRYQSAKNIFAGDGGKRSYRSSVKPSGDRKQKPRSESVTSHSGECLGDNPLLQQLKKEMQATDNKQPK